MANVELDYQVPPADLQPYVTLFYHFRADVPHFQDVERADHAQIRFRLSEGEGWYDFVDGSRQPAGSLHVIGPTTGPIGSHADGPVEIVGMGVQPAGWAAMLGIEASAMLNRAIDGQHLFGRRMAAARDAMLDAPDRGAKYAIAERFVREAVAGADTRAVQFAREIDAWLAGSASPDIEELVAATGLSRRHVERRCKTLYGAPPKVLARKYRALRAAVALASGHASLDTLIGEGFYDQSHLIREMKQFTGLTPRQMRTEPSLLAQLTIRQRAALAGQVHPIISNT